MRHALLFPAAAQALLTLAVLIYLAPVRARSMRQARQQLDDEEVRIGRNRWSQEAQKVSNNYRNQFELPVLFYAVIAYAMILGQGDALMVGLAWAFVASRIVHAAIHIGPNVIAWRAPAFLAGAVALSAMWVVLVWRMATGG